MSFTACDRRAATFWRPMYSRLNASGKVNVMRLPSHRQSIWLIQLADAG